MSKKSAGLLLYRQTSRGLEVLLVHPGGPFWAKKDNGAWSIPKGEYEDAEDPLMAAGREFAEETGFTADGNVIPLGASKQPSGKVISAWAMEKDVDATTLRSNTFAMEWPPKSGKQQEFPEIDRAAWFSIPIARQKLTKGQLLFLDQLESELGIDSSRSANETPEATTKSQQIQQPSLFDTD